jgi:cobalt/nickel transport system permease protein
VYLAFGRLVLKNARIAAVAAFAAGFGAVLLSGLLTGLFLLFTEENFLEVSGIIIAAHIPVMLIEGLVTAIAVGFLRKVRPEMLCCYPH